MYLLHHEEIEALALKHIPEHQAHPLLHDVWAELLNAHAKCLENVGMLSTTPIDFRGP